MHPRLHNAIRNALSLVKKSNVNEATAVIREALLANELEIFAIVLPAAYMLL